MEKNFSFSIEIKGIGKVSAIYKEIKELFTKRVLNFLSSTKNPNWQVETIYI